MYAHHSTSWEKAHDAYRRKVANLLQDDELSWPVEPAKSPTHEHSSSWKKAHDAYRRKVAKLLQDDASIESAQSPDDRQNHRATGAIDGLFDDHRVTPSVSEFQEESLEASVDSFVPVTSSCIAVSTQSLDDRQNHHPTSAIDGLYDDHRATPPVGEVRVVMPSSPTREATNKLVGGWDSPLVQHVEVIASEVTSPLPFDSSIPSPELIVHPTMPTHEPSPKLPAFPLPRYPALQAMIPTQEPPQPFAATTGELRSDTMITSDTAKATDAVAPLLPLTVTANASMPTVVTTDDGTSNNTATSTSKLIEARDTEDTVSLMVTTEMMPTAPDSSKAREDRDVDTSATVTALPAAATTTSKAVSTSETIETTGAETTTGTAMIENDLEKQKHLIIFRHLNLQTASKLDATGCQTHLSLQMATAKRVIAMASPFLESGDVVMDAGCGYAEALMHFSVVRPDLKYVGLEIDAKRILGYVSRVSKLQEELEPLGMKYDNIVVRHHDLHDVPYLVGVKLMYMYDQAFDQRLDEHMWTLAFWSLCCEFVLCMKPTKQGCTQTAVTTWVIDTAFEEIASCPGMASGGGESATWRLYRKKKEFLDIGPGGDRNARYFDKIGAMEHRGRSLEHYEALVNHDDIRHANGKNGTPEKAEMAKHVQKWGQEIFSPLRKRSFAAIEESATNEFAKVHAIISKKREPKKRRNLSEQCLALNAVVKCIGRCAVCDEVFRHCKPNWLEVKGSRIHKKGLFTKVELPKGKYVIEYSGSKTKTLKKPSPFALQLSGGTYIRGKTNCRFINHSCAPNCELRKWQYGEYNEKVSLVTLEDIPAGAELTACYQDFDPCLCGHCEG
jgi:hypothetical protein